MRELREFPPGWCCYLLLCSDDSYYCGITSNLAHRIRDHSSGKGSGYTKGAKPAALVWCEPHESRFRAAKRESQIKRWSREKKKLLANGHSVFEGIGRSVMVSLG
jgi:putative endonuclease